jgi:tRNA nucleotidyltransferase/poly(A) polymerase
MGGKLPSLANAGWLTESAVSRIFALFEKGGEEVRVVGGAVRNALMGIAVGEIDFATTALPEKTVVLAGAAGIKAVPTGIDHGTVTLVLAGHGYEVTTLREDIETDGRHAIVRFGRDWKADAERRDFTVNALSVDSAGTIHDPVGGYPDIAARRIRFIGDAERRIAEDRLRLLRLFRFHAEYGEGAIDPDGLSAAIRARNGLRDLSAERIGQEMRRLVVAPRAALTATLMQESGVLPVVLAGIGYLDQFTRLAEFEQNVGAGAAVAPRLVALACRTADDVMRVAERLRLSNADRDRMAAAIDAAKMFATPPDERHARHALYRLGPEAYRDGIAYAAASRGSDDPAYAALYALPQKWTAPVFPLSGRDVLALGITGPAVGETLRAIEAWWIEGDFKADGSALRSRLQQQMSAAQ